MYYNGRLKKDVISSNSWLDMRLNLSAPVAYCEDVIKFNSPYAVCTSKLVW